MKNEKTGLQRLVAAAGFSIQGMVAGYRNEAAFRQEVWLLVVLVPVALWFGDSISESLLLISSLLALLIVELLNSAVEAVVDRTGEEYHELSGRAKDMGSAAVLLTLITVVLVWVALLTN
ncbi:diacylglycerol kinase [Chromatiales bacterium (ex Bugula neritina AB1)]|nr:diacylglycerol kinase [Chromatiales bacterium (ex Bugula neritina AB1)]